MAYTMTHKRNYGNVQYVTKTEHPQDYTNMERHVWRSNEKQRRLEIQQQENNHKNHPGAKTTAKNSPDNHGNSKKGREQQDAHNQNESDAQITQNTHKQPPKLPRNLWEQLGLTKWGKKEQTWKCMINNCAKTNKTSNPNKTSSKSTQRIMATNIPNANALPLL